MKLYISASLYYAIQGSQSLYPEIIHSVFTLYKFINTLSLITTSEHVCNTILYLYITVHSAANPVNCRQQNTQYSQKNSNTVIRQ